MKFIFDGYANSLIRLAIYFLNFTIVYYVMEEAYHISLFSKVVDELILTIHMLSIIQKSYYLFIDKSFYFSLCQFKLMKNSFCCFGLAPSQAPMSKQLWLNWRNTTVTESCSCKSFPLNRCNKLLIYTMFNLWIIWFCLHEVYVTRKY